MLEPLLVKVEQVTWQPYWKKFREIGGMDKRSIAVWRVLVSFVILFDLWERWDDAYAHYSDYGVVPRQKVVELFWNNYWFSFSLMSGQVWFQKLLFATHATLAVCLMLGYKTRVTTILTWLFVLSNQARNFMVGHGGDVVLRMYLFWSIFLPMGDCYSIDSILNNNKSKDKKKDYMVFNVATVALQLQISFLYGFSAIHKTGDEWQKDYTATYYALQLEYFKTPVATMFLAFPTVLKVLTYFVLLWEKYGYLCFFFPYQTPYYKTFGVVGFVAMHIGFGACLKLGIFAPVCAAGVMTILPSEFWDRFFIPFLTRIPERKYLRIYYKYDNILLKWALLCMKEFFLITSTTEVLPVSKSDFLEGGLFQGESPDGYLFVQSRHIKLKRNYSGFLKLIELSPLIWFMAPIYNLSFIRKCVNFLFIITMPTEEPQYLKYVEAKSYPQQSSFITYFINNFIFVMIQFFVLVCLYIVFTWNLGNIGYPSMSTPESLKPMAWSLHLDQSWGMFAPHPPKSNWYYLIHCVAQNGEEFELFKNRGLHTWTGTSPFTYDEPVPFYDNVGNHRWFKLMEMMNSGQNNQAVRLLFGQFICREYNSRHPSNRIKNFTIYYFSQVQNLDGTRGSPQKQIFWEHVC